MEPVAIRVMAALALLVVQARLVQAQAAADQAAAMVTTEHQVVVVVWEYLVKVVVGQRQQQPVTSVETVDLVVETAGTLVDLGLVIHVEFFTGTEVVAGL